MFKVASRVNQWLINIILQGLHAWTVKMSKIGDDEFKEL